MRVIPIWDSSFIKYFWVLSLPEDYKIGWTPDYNLLIWWTTLNLHSGTDSDCWILLFWARSICHVNRPSSPEPLIVVRISLIRLDVKNDTWSFLDFDEIKAPLLYCPLWIVRKIQLSTLYLLMVKNVCESSSRSFKIRLNIRRPVKQFSSLSPKYKSDFEKWRLNRTISTHQTIFSHYRT